MSRAAPPSFLLMMEDYKDSYTRAIEGDRRMRRLPYAEMARAAFGLGLFYGDSYLHAFAERGLPAEQVVPMCRPLQYRWAAEQGLWTTPTLFGRNPMRWYWKRRYGEGPLRWSLRRIAAEQVRRARPDVLWVFSGIPVQREDLASWRRHAGSVALWWSCPLNERFPYDGFDLILSCIPQLVDEFRRRGLRAELVPHAFDARLGALAQPGPRLGRVAFVGNLSRDHSERTRFLEALAGAVELDFYGPSVDMLPQDSPLRGRYRGPAWGHDLYRIYGSYAVVVHKNLDMAGASASAKRLFEATGMGACLVTEASDDLGNLFRPGHEVLTYSGLDDCLALLRGLLDDPARAAAVGRAGQARTLRDHTYTARVGQILDCMEPALRPA